MRYVVAIYRIGVRRITAQRSILPWQSKAIDAAKIVRIDGLAVTVDHEPSCLRQCDGRSADRRQQGVPVAAIRNRMSNVRRAERLAPGMCERGENGIFERERSRGRGEGRRIGRRHDLALPHRGCGSKSGVVMRSFTCVIVMAG